MTRILVRERQREIQDRRYTKEKAMRGWRRDQRDAATTKDHLEPPEADRSPEDPVRGGPANLDFRLLASKAAGDYIPVVLSHQICDNLSQQPQESNTGGQKFLVAGIQGVLLGAPAPHPLPIRPFYQVWI